MGNEPKNDGSVRVGLIVACSENSVIGRDGDLPWHLPEDLKHFMRTTKGHAVIMGRKTFETLEKPLGGRLNVVISRSMSIDSQIPGQLAVVRSLQEAIDASRQADQAVGGFGKGLVWIAGGGEIYKQAMDVADLIVRTRVHCEIDGDTYFPDIDPDRWKLECSEEHPADDRHKFGFSIEHWIRRG